MTYPKKLLNDYETVAVDLHPHWWHFAKAAAALAASIVLGIFSLTLDGNLGTVLGWLSLVLIVGTALWLVQNYLTWSTTNFVITSDRVIYRTGLLRKHGIEIPLDRVNNVLFSQGVFERMIGAGDLLIESAGETGQQRFTDIRHPDEIQNLLHRQMEAKNMRTFGGNRGGSDDVASQLEKLEGMLQRGTLTPEEFARQKRKLLGE